MTSIRSAHTADAYRQPVPTDARMDQGSGALALQIISTGVDSDAPTIPSSVVPEWITRRVLLLNATYEPLTALPARRAIVLMACGKADTVHDDPGAPVVHSEQWALPVPAVIRLRTYVRVPYRARVPMTRAALMHRDRGRCGYCGAKAETIDHVVPRSRGGEHSWENCVACCAPCNHRKADKLLSELGWTLRSPLAAPTGQH
ncbi:MAG: HNH endonuclease, partial [Rhodococcus sp.]|nr:HNH endonuclease [Rhodococcus sp. (in: high G+C Gram-positive bacteria)]